MNSFFVVVLFCSLAVLCLLINIWKKLPKSIFAFLSVIIVVSVSWYTMDSGIHQEVVDRRSRLGGENSIFLEALRDVALPHGETRFSLPVFISGKRKGDCLRISFESENELITEQVFIQNVCFSLLAEDGTSIPAEWVQFTKEDLHKFPKSFVIKVYFVLPEHLSESEFRCSITNGLKDTFRISEISVASFPLSNGE